MSILIETLNLKFESNLNAYKPNYYNFFQTLNKWPPSISNNFFQFLSTTSQKLYTFLVRHVFMAVIYVDEIFQAYQNVA
jgi:hypothetical protein